MKASPILVALAIFSLASCFRCFAESRGNTVGFNSMSQLGLGQFSVNMAGGTFSNVNSITFESDQNLQVFADTFVSSPAPVSLLEMACETGAGTALAAKTSGRFRVPEPTTIALFFAAVGTLLLFRRRRRRMA